jgi:hypothetical protein
MQTRIVAWIIHVPVDLARSLNRTGPQCRKDYFHGSGRYSGVPVVTNLLALVNFTSSIPGLPRQTTSLSVSMDFGQVSRGLQMPLELVMGSNHTTAFRIANLCA